jgi:Mg2+ and Co2+ transporter CorA
MKYPIVINTSKHLDDITAEMMQVNQHIKSLEQSLALAVKRGISEKARERMDERLDDLNDSFIALVNKANHYASIK